MLCTFSVLTHALIYAPLPPSLVLILTVTPQGLLAHPLDDLWDFFETTIAYYKKLPSFKWLADAGIHPSNTTSYSLSDIQSALSDRFGELPFVGCSGPKYNETEAGKGSLDAGATVLSELWYYHHVNGRPQDVDPVPVPVSDSFRTTCAKADGAVWYYERSKGSERSSHK